MSNIITPWMTTAETAKYIKVAVSTLEAWRIQGRGPEFKKAENAVRYHVDAVNKWMDGI